MILQDGERQCKSDDAQRRTMGRYAVGGALALLLIGIFVVRDAWQNQRCEAARQEETDRTARQSQMTANLRSYIDDRRTEQAIDRESCRRGNGVLFPVASAAQHRADMEALLQGGTLPFAAASHEIVVKASNILAKRWNEPQIDPNVWNERLKVSRELFDIPEVVTDPGNPVHGLDPAQRRAQCGAPDFELDVAALGAGVVQAHVPNLAYDRRRECDE
jgi:hypothetical protein